MPTPMHVHEEIAARFEVEATDSATVTRCFTHDLSTLPERPRILIAEELYAREGEPPPAQQDWRQKLGSAMARRRIAHSSFSKDRTV